VHTQTGASRHAPQTAKSLKNHPFNTTSAAIWSAFKSKSKNSLPPPASIFLLRSLQYIVELAWQESAPIGFVFLLKGK
jgi:hypothetical protein